MRNLLFGSVAIWALVSLGCSAENKAFCSLDDLCGEGQVCDLSKRSCEDFSGEGDFAQRLVPFSKLDVLFVVDNSNSMREEQALLVSDAEHFFGGFGAQLDLHVGVISTDMGVGDPNDTIPGCEARGDEGRLHGEVQPGCGPDDPWLARAASLDGGAKNFPGEIADAFACMAELGTSGCGFEQPMASVEAALGGEVPENEGFLREDAFLTIVTLSDEDDCSAVDPTLFDTDPTQDHLFSQLGPLGSHRCFEHGVVCDQTDPDPAVDRANLEARTGCRPKEDSLYMRSVQQHVEFLKGLKGGRPLVWSTSIAAPADGSIELSANRSGEPSLKPVCQETAHADPAVRLAAVSDSFGLPTGTASICETSYAGILRDLASTASALVSGRCLAAQPVDASEEPGFQADCRVIDMNADGEAIAVLRQCDESESGACFRIEADAGSCPSGPGLVVSLERGDEEAPPNTEPMIYCRAAR